LDTAVTTTSVLTTTTAFPIKSEQHKAVRVKPQFQELAFNLGLWLSGLESFLNIQNHSFAEESRAKSALREWTKEFRLAHSTLLLCSSLNFQLAEAVKNGNQDEIFAAQDFDISVDEIFALSQCLKDAILLSEGLLRGAPLKFGEWTAWSNSLTAKLKKEAAFEKLIKFAEKTGERFLPEILQHLLKRNTLPAATEADLKLILPRIAKILKWLSAIEEMIRQDKPLKTTLLLFARIYEQIEEMMSYINNRLLRFPNEEEPLFAALDATVYVASIELRKVYQQELIGVTEIRPSPQVRARIEASYGLLNDSFEQTLAGFAQLINPHIKTHELFPVYKIKLEQSLVLRKDLWTMMKAVQNAEQNPEAYPMETLRQRLTNFTGTTMRYLLYKDWETFERFVEEVVRTQNKKDLVPILHRFGAYLETLFGQINMRAVLADHPFEYTKE
jgi:hypothetical protein